MYFASVLLDIWPKGGIKVIHLKCCLLPEGQGCRYAVSALPCVYELPQVVVAITMRYRSVGIV